MDKRLRAWRLSGMMLIMAAVLALSGCGLVALPFRVSSAAVKAVPVAGHIVAAPLDATAGIID